MTRSIQLIPDNPRLFAKDVYNTTLLSDSGRIAILRYTILFKSKRTHELGKLFLLVPDSSAPSLYPSTCVNFSTNFDNTYCSYLIPVQLLTSERQRSSQALKRLLSHLLICFVQRDLVFPFLLFD